MQNMVMSDNGNGNPLRIYFDIVDGDIQNVTVKDSIGPLVVSNMEVMKDMIAALYTSELAAATEMFKTGHSKQYC